MTNAELIKGLRWCADESICCDDFSGEKCPYFDEKKDSCSVDEILHAAADALEADEQRIAELEAQMSKEGEWIEVHDWLQIPQEERGTYRCSGCGQVMKYPWNYCPNCGARMKNENQTDNV